MPEQDDNDPVGPSGHLIIPLRSNRAHLVTYKLPEPLRAHIRVEAKKNNVSPSAAEDFLRDLEPHIGTFQTLRQQQVEHISGNAARKELKAWAGRIASFQKSLTKLGQDRELAWRIDCCITPAFLPEQLKTDIDARNAAASWRTVDNLEQALKDELEKERKDEFSQRSVHNFISEAIDGLDTLRTLIEKARLLDSTKEGRPTGHLAVSFVVRIAQLYESHFGKPPSSTVGNLFEEIVYLALPEADWPASSARRLILAALKVRKPS